MTIDETKNPPAKVPTIRVQIVKATSFSEAAYPVGSIHKVRRINRFGHFVLPHPSNLATEAMDYSFLPDSVEVWAAEGADATWLDETEAAVAEKLPPNPKQLFGDKKPPLDEFPLSAHIHACLSHLDGDNKYGFRNWRDHPVEARTYIKGIMRHLRLFEVGEDFARDTLAHNLGAVIAGSAILIDAQLHGTMIDNRRHSKQEADLLHAAEADVARLNALQKERDAKKAEDEAARLAVEGAGLCVDEGCPHSGEPHVCVPAPAADASHHGAPQAPVPSYLDPRP